MGNATTIAGHGYARLGSLIPAFGYGHNPTPRVGTSIPLIGADPSARVLVGADPSTRTLVGADPSTRTLVGASPAARILEGADPSALTLIGE
jgi:hypothetical protein